MPTEEKSYKSREKMPSGFWCSREEGRCILISKLTSTTEWNWPAADSAKVYVQQCNNELFVECQELFEEYQHGIGQQRTRQRIQQQRAKPFSVLVVPSSVDIPLEQQCQRIERSSELAGRKSSFVDPQTASKRSVATIGFQISQVGASKDASIGGVRASSRKRHSFPGSLSSVNRELANIRTDTGPCRSLPYGEPQSR